MATSNASLVDGPCRSMREVPPGDFLFTIESYSLLKDSAVEKYESDIFQACGVKWKLILYPRGDSRRNGEGHVSLYLAIANTNDLSGGGFNVTFKLFVFDKNNDKYLTIQDADGVVRRFHGENTEWGFDQLISLEELLSPSNGYLHNDNDKCVFGAEVSVISRYAKRETLSFVNGPPRPFPWTLEKFSQLNETSHFSESFTVGERNWKLKVCLSPRGRLTLGGRTLSLSLRLITNPETFPSNKPVYASYKFKILNQLNNTFYVKTGSHWFDGQNLEAPCPEFISLSELSIPRPGTKFIKDDAIILVVEILKISKVRIDQLV